MRSSDANLLASDSRPRNDTADLFDAARPWYHLSLPGTRKYAWFPRPARDPLLCWPDEYEPTIDTPAWEHCLTNWKSIRGYRKGIFSDTGFHPAVVNYTFNNLLDHIPSYSDGASVEFGYEREDAFIRKQSNFYGMLQYIKDYPTTDKMRGVLGVDDNYFYKYVRMCRHPVRTHTSSLAPLTHRPSRVPPSQIEPTIFCSSRNIDFMDWKLRIWDYNHTEYFPERVLTSFDGFPIQVGGSGNKWVSRLTKSKKYGTHVVTADLGIMLASGCPVDYSLQLGVRNDSRKWMDHKSRRARMYPWEYALGDKADVGCPEFLSEFKDYGSLKDDELRWNDTLQFFRGRNEHLVAAVKHGRHALDTTWRGSFAGLAAVLRIVMHMVTLQERMLGPRYDCFGPWPVCPDSIVRRYV